MSEWLVHLVQIGKFGNHPNADTLCISQIYGQNILFKKGTYQEGDLAVYIPPDTVLPMDPNHPLLKDNAYLKPGKRVDAIRLRGIFSNGFTIPARELFTPEELKDIPVGTDVSQRIGVTKYEDEGEKLSTGGENEPDRGFMPVYTDIEAWPKYRNYGIINPGDEVVITLKLHGCNMRAAFRNSRIWVGSRTQVKASYTVDGEERNLWWKVAKEMELEKKFLQLRDTSPEFDLDDLVVYGEVFGQVQDLKYGIDKGASFRIFDTYSHKLGRYNDWDITETIAKAMGIETVPVLFKGPWAPELEELRNGMDPIGKTHVREGFVLKPIKEQWNQWTKRTCFKYVGENYKLRKRK